MYLLHRKKNDIYANISILLSYSEVTVATRSGPYPAQMITAVRSEVALVRPAIQKKKKKRSL